MVVTHPVLPRRMPTKIPTLSSGKANTSTSASTPENVEKLTTSSPSSVDSVEGDNHLRNGNGELNSVSIGNGNRELNGVSLGNGIGNGIGELPTDWSKSYHGLSSVAFSKDISDVLQAPVDSLDIEMKPGELFMSYCN